jgi:Ca-activated chloride channel family protein
MTRSTTALLMTLGSVLAPPAAAAQDRNSSTPTVFVVDASNSMWGRLEGRPKIEIARESVTALIASLPQAMRIGLVAYGHRRAGDCSDIETVLPVATVNRAKIEALAGRLVPRGKTPITGALREAAGQLEAGKPGTIVLVTDGIETCGGDPCALATELKRKNASLIAHVVGFDLSGNEGAKLSCIADRTGGTFVAASNARELAAALMTTAQAKPKPVVPSRSVELEATDGGRVEPDATFAIARSSDTTAIADGVSGTVSLAPGRYRITAATPFKSGQTEVEVTKDAPARISVALTGTLPKASLQPAKTNVPATGTVEVRWTGPNGKGDYVVIARPDGDALETRHYSYTRNGNPLPIRVPGEPGEYELRYVFDAAGVVLARAKISATPVTATIEAPAQGMAGTEIQVAFTGPDAEEDWVGLAKPGSDPSSYDSGAWLYANNGSPAHLQLPAEPGTYEVRYVSGLDPKVLAAKLVTVTPASAAVTAPERGVAGSSIDVGFRGTGGGDTFIGIVRKGAAASDYIGGAYARPKGDQVRLRLPGEPGLYEVRFVLEANSTYRILASTPIEIEPASANLSAPDRVKRGEPFTVAFSGPSGEGDFVTIVPTDSEPAAFTDFRYATPDTTAVTIRAPDEAGSYELRYVMTAPGETDHMILAKKPIQVE